MTKRVETRTYTLYMIAMLASPLWSSTYVNIPSSNCADPKVAMLGAMQALFEGAMYTFVFLWTPALSPKGEHIPHGMIFACFMVSSMVGSAIAGRLLNAQTCALPLSGSRVLQYYNCCTHVFRCPGFGSGGFETEDQGLEFKPVNFRRSIRGQSSQGMVCFSSNLNLEG